MVYPRPPAPLCLNSYKGATNATLHIQSELEDALFLLFFLKPMVY